MRCLLGIRCLAPAVATLALAGQAAAIDHFVFHVLPSIGFGGNALGADYEAHAACGYVLDSVGNQHACGWATFPSDVLIPLPGAGGMNSEANDCSKEEDGPLMAVGRAQDPGGTWKPVFWKETSPGTIVLADMPILSGVSGNALAIYVSEETGLADVVGTIQSVSGRTHATLWHETMPGVFTVTDLGTLGGNNSEAVALRPALIGASGSPDLTIVGRAQKPNGMWHAAEWDFNYNTGPDLIDRHPGGASSGLTGISMFHDQSGFMSCGTRLMANGRSHGFFDVPAEFTLQAPGFSNTAAMDITGHEISHGVRVVGSAWDDASAQTAMVWTVLPDLANANIYTANTLDTAAAGMGVHFNTSGQHIIAGFMDYTDDACMFLSDGSELPDDLTVPVGNAAGKVNETQLWGWDLQNNGFRVRTQNGAGDAASIVTRFYGLGDTATHLHIALGMSTFGSTSATGQTVPMVWNFATNQWDAGPPVTVGSSLVKYEWDFGYQNHISPATGEVRLRFDSHRTSGNVQGFQYNLAQLWRM